MTCQITCLYKPRNNFTCSYDRRLILYTTKIYYTQEIYFPLVVKVLYWPQRINFIIRGEAENDKNDPERPILHFYY